MSDGNSSGAWSGTMRIRTLSVIVLAGWFVGGAAAQDARSVIDGLARTLGAVTSLQYSGSGYVYGFGQRYQPGGPWAKFNLKSYTFAADSERQASREEQVRTYLDPPERGGTAVFIGEFRQV